jgi:hypothetical protein
MQLTTHHDCERRTPLSDNLVAVVSIRPDSMSNFVFVGLWNIPLVRELEETGSLAIAKETLRREIDSSCKSRSRLTLAMPIGEAVSVEGAIFQSLAVFGRSAANNHHNSFAGRFTRSRELNGEFDTDKKKRCTGGKEIRK